MTKSRSYTELDISCAHENAELFGYRCPDIETAIEFMDRNSENILCSSIEEAGVVGLTG